MTRRDIDTDQVDLIAETIKALKAGISVRQDLPYGGRLHFDRSLPFLFVHELHEVRPQLAAQQICTANAAYLLTKNRGATAPLINAIGALMRERFGGFLLFEISELQRDVLLKEDSPYLPPFEIKLSVGVSSDAAAVRTAFYYAIQKLEVRYRSPQIEHVSNTVALKSKAERWLGLNDDIHFVHVAFAPIYRHPESDSVYPELLQRIVTNLYDSSLQAVCAYVDQATNLKPRSHQSLGRQAITDAVHRVDRQLDKICDSFDFLLSVTPINTKHAWSEFSNGEFKKTPRLLYRPLTSDVEEQKRKLFSISFDQLEDPVLLNLYQEKQQEIDMQLTMLQLRNTCKFPAASRVLYGSVEDSLKRLARDTLSDLNARSSMQECADEDGTIDCHMLKSLAEEMIETYRSKFKGFDPDIKIRDDVPPGLMVSGSTLLISSHTSMTKSRVEALLSHEIGVHLLTYFNGDAQGLRLFRSGLAGYEGVQEGLAVFAEYAVGGMTAGRLRLLAARVLACDAMLSGADFTETYHLLTNECGLPKRGAFYVTVRVYRGNGLAKDAIYLRGLKQILAHLENGGDLEPFWIGKIAATHLPVIEEFRARGLLKSIPVTPVFMSQSEANKRIIAARSGLSPMDLIAA